MVKLSLGVSINHARLQYKIVGELEAEVSANQEVKVVAIGFEVPPERIKDIYTQIQALEQKGYSADYI